MRWCAVVVAAASCRYGFDPITPPGDGTGGIDSSPNGIAFVQQGEFDSNTSFATVSVTLPQPQKAGDLNLAVVAWGSTANDVSSITDSAGNAYALAIGPTINTCDAQSTYVASNIAASASNTVTVTYNATVTFPTLLVLEYSGLTSIDKVADGTGSSIDVTTTAVTTTAPHALVFGAGVPDNCAPPNFESAGSGYTQRTITNVSGMLAEDIIAAQLGTFEATGTLTAASPWVMQTVALE